MFQSIKRLLYIVWGKGISTIAAATYTNHDHINIADMDRRYVHIRSYITYVHIIIALQCTELFKANIVLLFCDSTLYNHPFMLAFSILMHIDVHMYVRVRMIPQLTIFSYRKSVAF